MQVMIQNDPGRREPRWRVKQDVAIDVPDYGVPRNQVVTVRNLSENGLCWSPVGCFGWQHDFSGARRC